MLAIEPTPNRYPILFTTGGDYITIQIHQTITGKISLDQMKARSREYRANGERSINRLSTKSKMGSLLLRAADGRPCPTCSTTMQYCPQRRPGHADVDIATIEHILPIKEGGRNASNNVIAMCLACNSSRGYVYNEVSKNTQAEIDEVLEWLWYQLHPEVLSRVVTVRIGDIYPHHQSRFLRNWKKRYQSELFEIQITIQQQPRRADMSASSRKKRQTLQQTEMKE